MFGLVATGALGITGVIGDGLATSAPDAGPGTNVVANEGCGINTSAGARVPTPVLALVTLMVTVPSATSPSTFSTLYVNVMVVSGSVNVPVLGS